MTGAFFQTVVTRAGALDATERLPPEVTDTSIHLSQKQMKTPLPGHESELESEVEKTTDWNKSKKERFLTSKTGGSILNSKIELLI
ncbi:MAG: hypothetical protein WA705_25450 [Candidatus Ozemobacteraceae bacterium]